MRVCGKAMKKVLHM